MENNKGILISIAIIMMACLILLCLLFILDTSIGTNQSLSDRVTWLENKMIERTKPIIQVNRATIYNTEGEIVLETKEQK